MVLNSKKLANLKTILYLGKITKDIKSINIYQKLNFILKINDYFILNFNPQNVDKETINIACHYLIQKKK